LLTSISNSEITKKASSIVIGPGSGRDEIILNFIQKLRDEHFEKVVLDADGLRLLSNLSPKKLPSHWILTPHAGELGDLLDCSSAEVETDRLGAVKKASEKWGCHVLLKGFRSLVATPDGRVFIIGSGNSALAKAGSGDVLSGFIGALLGQGLDSLSSVTVGAFIHGRVADQYVKRVGNNKTLMASDLPQLISEELSRLENA
jgi:NAD(P)H-hydrate epimerase